MDNNILGKKIQKARNDAHLSQRNLAALCGITQAQLCRIENGSINKPNTSTLSALVNVLDIKLDDFKEILVQYGYTTMQIIKIYHKDKLEDFLATADLSQETDRNKALIQLFCTKISTLSEKDKSIIEFILTTK